MLLVKKATNKGHSQMKHTKSGLHRKYHSLPHIQFEQQKLTSFAGLILFQPLFSLLRIKERLAACFAHLPHNPVFGYASILLLLITHFLLGFRRIREMRFYQNDPLVARFLGLTQLPDFSSLCRLLRDADAKCVRRLRRLLSALVLGRLRKEHFTRITVDFDGSVLGTKRQAEASAVGYNKKKKGQRSYYPLFATVAQTGQVLDVLPRSGNVHDSNGACAFISQCLSKVRAALPFAQVEVRMDGAFFSQEIVRMLSEEKVEFTVSVPFERLTELKTMVENRERWIPCNGTFSFFELAWKPKCWEQKGRFLVIRQKQRTLDKQPLQLDLFRPLEWEYTYKVIHTNKGATAKTILRFHNGRGYQENIFAELKDENQMDYIPFKRYHSNLVYLLACALSHNLARELQMQTRAPDRGRTENRTPQWIFEKIGTFRRNILLRAAQITRPQGKLTLTISGNEAVKESFLAYLNPLRKAA